MVVRGGDGGRFGLCLPDSYEFLYDCYFHFPRL